MPPVPLPHPASSEKLQLVHRAMRDLALDVATVRPSVKNANRANVRPT